jgi:hypothetical protein
MHEKISIIIEVWSFVMTDFRSYNTSNGKNELRKSQMTNAPRTFSYPLSEADRTEIHRRAAHERSLAVTRIFGGMARGLKSLFRGRPVGQPTPQFDVP